MKNFAAVLAFCLLIFNQAKADDLDLLSDDIQMMTNAENEQQGIDAQDVDADESEDGEQHSSLFGFIIKPISNFFSSNENSEETVDGPKETPLERTIRLADEGNLDSQMNLAYMYLYGQNGVEQDFKKAFKYYDMAAQQNDPIALNNLGSLYFSGIGTKKNNEYALTLFKKAAELGNDNAALNLAFIYLTGGTKNDIRNAKAFQLFEKSQKAGNKIAEFMVGYAYYKGFVVPQNYEMAYKLIKASAGGKAKIDEAQLVLADMYKDGHGTVQNYASAINAYQAAVGQGNMEAILTLADIFSAGKITPSNPVLAHALYNVAAAQNIADAAEKRDRLNRLLQLEQLMAAQDTAQNFKSQPSELTSYIRQTYGNNIRNYIDINMPGYKK